MSKGKEQSEHTHIRDKEATRQRILEAAEEVFAEKGYHGAVVDDIVRTADMSKGGFYFHFPNKQAIFLALMEALTPRLISTAERAIAQETDPVASIITAQRRRKYVAATTCWINPLPVPRQGPLQWSPG